MNNTKLLLYKSLLNYEKISVLDLMRKNPELLEVPGYEISKMLKEGVKEGFIEESDGETKLLYTANKKCKDIVKQLEAEKEAETKQIKKEENKKRIKVASLISLVCFSIAAVIVFFTAILPMLKTKAFINKYGQAAYDKYGLVKKGDYIKLGTYKWQEYSTYKNDSIEWLVLDEKDGKMLLISKYLVESSRYNSSYVQVSGWTSSTLYQWLNNEFYNTAFSEEEKQLLTESSEGKVSLLSLEEFNTYFDKNDRKCSPYNQKYHSSWWLRTLGWENYNAKIVDPDYFDEEVSITEYCGVRPIIWIDLSKTK